MKDAIEVLKTRRSIRSFNGKEVPEEIVKQIVECGTYAPTAKNRQTPTIIAIMDKKTRDEIADLNRKIGGWPEGFDPFYGAPAILLVIAENDERNFGYMDGSLVMGNLMNAAWGLGVGSIWIHRAYEEVQSEYGKALLKRLGIQGNYIGIGHCALGYFDGENPEPKPRKENYVYWVK
ncbi:MAG: nitroreductase [Bacilli bacterium]|nr:nitroreductase [Bacilli bacterium]